MAKKIGGFRKVEDYDNYEKAQQRNRGSGGGGVEAQ
jgi:hypothetical protein